MENFPLVAFGRMARLLLDIGVAETEESLLRQAVSRGRELIGLDRIGLWKN